MRGMAAVGLIGLLAACGSDPQAPAADEAANERVADESGNLDFFPPPPPAENATAAPATDSWVGRWRGVEGLNLKIARDPVKGEGHYKLAMRYTLDDQGSFDGVATPAGIAFSRPDGPQLLRATDGDATGLKYLAGKQDCLTVKQGEGYCRD